MKAAHAAGYLPDRVLDLIRRARDTNDPADIRRALAESFRFIDAEGRAVELATVHYNAATGHNTNPNHWYCRVDDERDALGGGPDGFQMYNGQTF